MVTRAAAAGIVLAATAGLVWSGGNQEKPGAEPPANATPPPASQPAEGRRTLRPRPQEEIVNTLIRDRERTSIILPQRPEAVLGREAPTSQPASGSGGPALLVDGTMLVERPGRLVYEEGKAFFAFITEAVEPELRAMELLRNRLLEATEREAQLGTSEFVISAEVTRYKDRNYLILRKVLRRVDHGNLAP